MAHDVALDRVPFTYSGTAEDEPALAIVEAVSWVKGDQPEELGMLHDIIDVDTLNELFRCEERRPERAGLKLSFRYEGYLVTVEPGLVWVERT